MRRKDREMPREFGISVLDRCEYATRALIDPDGFPYCVPITIVREGDALYFHSAREGYKADCLMREPRVCLSCVGDTRRPPDKFTTEYESAIITGTAAPVTNPEEKLHALRLLCQRHTPTNMAMFDSEAARSLPRTAVWKISIHTLTAKRKKYDENGVEMKYGRIE